MDNKRVARPQQPVNQVVVGAQTAGQHTGLGSFTYHNPEAAAMLARLITPQNPPNFDNKGNRTVTKPNVNNLSTISASIANHAEDAESIMQLFSDMKIASELLISSVRSPNDMYEGEINFALKDNLHVMPLQDKLIPLVKSYFSDIYPLNDKTDKIFRATMFGEGSYPILVMPENSLSDLIYGKPAISVESVDGKPVPERKRYLRQVAKETVATQVMRGEFLTFPSTGIFGSGANVEKKNAFERFGDNKPENSPFMKIKDTFDHPESKTKVSSEFSCESILFTDNPRALQVSTLYQVADASMRAEAMEAINDKKGTQTFNDRELAQLLYRNTTGRKQEFVKIKTDGELKRYSVGRPFIFEVPPESIIPVINKARANDPVGFILMLDRDGAPLSRLSEVNQFKALRDSVNSIQQTGGNGGYGDMSSYLLNKTASVFGTTCEEVSMKQVGTIFEEIMEAEYAARFRTGYFGTEATVADIKRMSELMLHRVLANQQTQMLFVPAAMMVYFNYDTRPNGTGKNMLEDSMTVSSLRAQLMFARVMGGVKNAIGRRTVGVEIDPDEPDPQRVYDMIKSEVVMAGQQNTAPMSINTTDLINQIQAMSLDFQVSGNESLPNTKITYTENNSNYARPDDEMMRELADLTINHTGVPPEMIEEARRVDFASAAARRNVLFSKRVRDIQRVFDPQFSRLVNIMLLADTTFIIEIKKLISENLDDLDLEHDELNQLAGNNVAIVDFLCMEFISNLTATLAQPDVNSLENNLEAIRKKEEIVDAAIEYWVSSTSVNSLIVGEQAAENIEAYKGLIKSAIMRHWMSESGILPEVAEIFSQNEDGSRMWDVTTSIMSHGVTAAKLITDIMKEGGRIARAADATVGEQPPAPGASDAGGGSFGGGSSFDTGGSFGDGGGDTGGDGGFSDFDAAPPGEDPMLSMDDDIPAG